MILLFYRNIEIWHSWAEKQKKKCFKNLKSNGLQRENMKTMILPMQTRCSKPFGGPHQLLRSSETFKFSMKEPSKTWPSGKHQRGARVYKLVTGGAKDKYINLTSILSSEMNVTFPLFVTFDLPIQTSTRGSLVQPLDISVDVYTHKHIPDMHDELSFD